MDPEEAELLSDYRYRSYAAVIEKALRNFESSSEWADLISSLGKLNKALQSNVKYSLLPRRLLIGKRLAQCLHPALPSGVHLKALETYDIIFKIIGTKWLARDLFIYSSGLFPLLSHAAMAVKPVLLGLYERYFLPLQKALLPSLQAFTMGLLPGLEEGLEVYDRTDALLCKLGVLLGQRVLYGSLWGSLLVCPLVRLPTTLFIVAHYDRMAAPRLQTHMLGTDHALVVKAVCVCLQDANVLVQRNMLEIVLYFFPFATCLDPAEGALPMSRQDMVTVVSAATLTLLRRDMSLNRRLYAWILGTDIKGGMVAPDPAQSTTLEEHTNFYFNTHSRQLLREALVSILKQREGVQGDQESVVEYLKPFRVVISLLDKPDIGPVLVSDVLLEVLRAFHTYCTHTIGEEGPNTDSKHTASMMKEHKVSSEIIKTVNVLFSSMSPDYLWDYLTKHFHSCLSAPTASEESKGCSSPPSVTELSTLIMFLLDVIPLELDSEIQTLFLPQMLSSMLRSLRAHMTSLSQSELTQALRMCFKVLGKIQIPMAYMDMEAEAHTRLEGEDGEQAGTGGPQANGNHDNNVPAVAINGQEAGPRDASFPPLRSEDSGLGLSASPSEQHLIPGRDWSDPGVGVWPQKEDVWRKGGAVETITHTLQDLLAAVINSYLLCVVEEDQEGKAAAAVPEQSVSSPGRRISGLGRRSSRDPHISMPQIKDRLAEIFTPHKLKQRSQSADSDGNLDQGGAWLQGYARRGKGQRSEVAEAGRQAFTAACYLLLESTTFPLYLTHQENTHLYDYMFNNTGTDKGTLPEWLRALMALCCLSKDPQVQHVGISTLLELVNHSHTLALVVQDKTKRARATTTTASTGSQSGHLQMVTVPPIHPGTLTTLGHITDFYQRVAEVLWSQLDSERPDHHLSCVELFYRLHCLAPSPRTCEDIICLGLLHPDKAVRLESLQRFAVLWHLTREMQFSMSLSIHRSFDRSLFVVLDSLNSEDSSILAAGESWLLRALSLGDALRILEPVLLLLLDPSTQKTSIQHVKHPLATGNLKVLSSRGGRLSSHPLSGAHGDAAATKDQSEASVLNGLLSVDREALWRELNRDPEQEQASDWTPGLSVNGSEETSEEEEGKEEEEDEESEHTESADTSTAQVSTETNSSSSGSGSAPYLHPHHLHGNGEDGLEVEGPGAVRRVDSARTQASDWASSEEEAEHEELEALARGREMQRRRDQQQAADALFTHALLYTHAHTLPHTQTQTHAHTHTQTHAHTRLLRPLGMLGSLLGPAGSRRAAAVVRALGHTPLEYVGHLSLLQELLQRHLQAEQGYCSFYGQRRGAEEEASPHKPPPPATAAPSSSSSSPSSSPRAPGLLLELLLSLCTSFLRSYYPSYAGVGASHLHANRALQVRSAEVLARLASELVAMTARGEEVTSEVGGEGGGGVWRLLGDCKVQEYALLTLCASMHTHQRAHAHTHAHAHSHTHARDTPNGTDALMLQDPDDDIEGGGVSEEGLVEVGSLSEAASLERPLQVALLRLLRVLILLEHHLWPPSNHNQQSVTGVTNHHPSPPPTSSTHHGPGSGSGSSLAREWATAVGYQQSIRAVAYVRSQPLAWQGLFVCAASRALGAQYGYSLHPCWLELLGGSLPFLGRSVGLIAAPLLGHMCHNMDLIVRTHTQHDVQHAKSSGLRKESIAPDYLLTLLEGMTDITHYCLLDTKKGADAADVRNARNAVLEEFPHMLSSMALLWGVVKGEGPQRRAAGPAHSGRHSSTAVYFNNTKVLRQKVLEFLCPLSRVFGVQLMASVGAVWSSRRGKKKHRKNKILCEASESRLTIVHLVKSVSTLRTDTILQLVKEVVKKPHLIKGDQKSSLVDVPMLQFSYAFIQSLPAQCLHDNMVPLLTLLKESAQLNLAPPGHFLLLGILNDFVNRLPNIDNKRDTRELQEVTQRILEAVGGVAGSSLEQTSWLSRNLEVKAQPQVCLQPEEDDQEDHDLYDSVGQGSTMVSSSAPSVYSVQALALLAEVLAPLLDMVFRSDEKEKAVPLISRLMYYVFPYLKNHSAYNSPSFLAGAQLLASLSGYAYTKRAWKKEVLELYMDPLFFHMDQSASTHWRSIIDHLLTHEKTMFKDLMSMQSSSLKLFSSADQKPMLLKRQAFAMLSGELDQYHLYLPLIQERLTESLRTGQTASLVAQMFLMFRVVLLRISPQHLTSLWPIMVTELIRIFVRLEKALTEDKEAAKPKQKGVQERPSVLSFPAAELDMYLSACKFLDMAISFPPERMPLFQMYRWAFVPEVDVESYSGMDPSLLLDGDQECTPHISRILLAMQRRYKGVNGVSGESSTDPLEFPLLTLRSLSSITELHPFLMTLSCSFRPRPPGDDHGDDPWPAADYPVRSPEAALSRLEHITQDEFLSNMES